MEAVQPDCVMVELCRWAAQRSMAQHGMAQHSTAQHGTAEHSAGAGARLAGPGGARPGCLSLFSLLAGTGPKLGRCACHMWQLAAQLRMRNFLAQVWIERELSR